MPTRSPAPVETNLLAIVEKQGEMYATLREVKHVVQNVSGKMDGVGMLVTRVEDMIRRLEDHDQRIRILEVAEHRRQGAVGLVEWTSRHWPVAVLLAVMGAIWAFVTGKIG